jgi:uncharacterized protein (TIGR02145 family)
MKLLSTLFFILCLNFLHATGDSAVFVHRLITTGFAEKSPTDILIIRWEITAGQLNGKIIYSESHQVAADFRGQIILQLGSDVALHDLSESDSILYARFWLNDQPHSIYKIGVDEMRKRLHNVTPAFTHTTGGEQQFSEFASLLPFDSNFQCNDYIFYAGRFYRTVSIGEQCWMAENLNVGTFITGQDSAGRLNRHGSDCNQIVKNCYWNREENCDILGALYEWQQAMCGAISPGAQGICPAGWHIPTFDEWTILERFICMDQGNEDCEKHFLWEEEKKEYVYHDAFRGTNEGSFLRASYGWLQHDRDDDIYGFSALPGKIRWSPGSFRPPHIDDSGCWHTSSRIDKWSNWKRMIFPSYNNTIFRSSGYSIHACSVRCVKD